jgi:hypothetical protein
MRVSKVFAVDRPSAPQAFRPLVQICRKSCGDDKGAGFVMGCDCRVDCGGKCREDPLTMPEFAHKPALIAAVAQG